MLRQYVYFCTSKASKLSTSEDHSAHAQKRASRRYSVYLLYQYKSTHTDSVYLLYQRGSSGRGSCGPEELLDTQFTCLEEPLDTQFTCSRYSVYFRPEEPLADTQFTCFTREPLADTQFTCFSSKNISLLGTQFTRFTLVPPRTIAHTQKSRSLVVRPAEACVSMCTFVLVKQVN